MPQVITLHVGQCGVQIGHNMWTMMLHDMNIDKGGLAAEYDADDFVDRASMVPDSFFERLFSVCLLSFLKRRMAGLLGRFSSIASRRWWRICT